MVLLTFVWKCFPDRNFHGVVVGLYEQSIESWVGLTINQQNLIIPIVQTKIIFDSMSGKSLYVTDGRMLT